MSWIIALLVLSALIFFHELGHYAMARYMGVFVEVFSIGFGKKLFSFKMFGTDWRIAAIPLGGYVKMKGQEDLDPSARSSDDDSYNSKTPLQRIAILLAGPAANFILAFMLYFAIALGSPPAITPIIGEVVADSPAAKAGLKSGDRILSIDTITIETWKEMAELISSTQKPIFLQIERDGYIEQISLTPTLKETTNIFKEKIQRPMIGISSAGKIHTQNLSLSESVVYASEQTYEASKLIFLSVQKLLSGAVPASELGGVVSIVKITSDASSQGWMAILFFAALISVNLGVLNLLPIPALDGGHIMFNIYELITKKAPSEAVFVKLTIAGWVMLLALMSLGLYNDINRLIQ